MTLIGKSRHTSSPRGVLPTPTAPGAYRHAQFPPTAELEACVAHYWTVEWELPAGLRQQVETAPHPNVHMVFEADGTWIYGVPAKKFVRILEGQSQVFGVKFQPGGFRGFLGRAVASIRGRVLAAAPIFGPEVEAIRREVFTATTGERKVEIVEVFLAARRPAPDPAAAIAAHLVSQVLREPDIRSVDELAERTATGKRTVQRLFREYVGTSPKWVIQRYRMHELLERLKASPELDWAATAAELGYFDQSHLIRDFRAVVGVSPAKFVKQLRG